MASTCFQHSLLIIRSRCTSDIWYIACVLYVYIYIYISLLLLFVWRYSPGWALASIPIRLQTSRFLALTSPFVYSHLSQVRIHVIQPSRFWPSSASCCIVFHTSFWGLLCPAFFLCDQTIVFVGF
jgi:hypothetical protein